MVSALLGFMAISGVLGKWNLARIRVELVPPDEIYDGVSTLVKVALINERSWLPAFFMEVWLDNQKLLFPLVDAGQGERKNLTMTFNGRGEHPPAQPVVKSRFPVNFFIRELGVVTSRPILVFPRPVACQMPLQADPGGYRGARHSQLKGESGDITRIRDYQGGEPLKQIHWKLTARHDQLKIKELSAVSRAPVILDLQTLSGANLEQRLSSATWLVNELSRNGRAVGLKGRDMEISPDLGQRHRLLLLQILAYYGQDKDAA